MLFGQYKYSDRLLQMLELGSKYPTGRYRDIYLNSKGTKIILYTGMGEEIGTIGEMMKKVERDVTVPDVL